MTIRGALYLALGLLLGAQSVLGAASSRPVEILPESRVAEIQAMLPIVTDPWLNDLLYSTDTMWYDKTTIIPGYQDSYGNSNYPIGFRPNTIAPGLIDGAVPGGHAMLFIRQGEFHFPFGRTGGVDDASNTFVVDFWNLPRDKGKILPAVWWRRKPNGGTNRIEYLFPEGTVFGEVIFIQDKDGKAYIFEIRTRRRALNEWISNAYRPFPTADSLAMALDTKRRGRSDWISSPSITRLFDSLRDPATLVSSKVGGTHFKGAFATVAGDVDLLPAINDNSILIELLQETPFQSAKGSVWKQNGGLRSYAASTNADFSVVPKNYNAALFEVSDEFCNRCHQDAGRPFRDYYPIIQAYGELWGGDDTFSWHPFEAKAFVDSAGKVVNFNNDNRRIREDFVAAGVIETYDSSKHTASRYRDIPRSWKNYVYPP